MKTPVGDTCRAALAVCTMAALVIALGGCDLLGGGASEPLSGTLKFTYSHYANQDDEYPQVSTTSSIVGATVNLKQYDEESSAYETVATAATDASGSFRFQSLASGQYAVEAVFTLPTSESLSCYVEYSKDAGVHTYVISTTYLDDAENGTTLVTTDLIEGVTVISAGSAAVDIHAFGSNLEP